MENEKNTEKQILGRNDGEAVRLRMVCGLAGYAVYVMLEEKLAEAGGSVAADYYALGYDFHADAALVKQVAEDFGLFALSPDGKTLKRKEQNKETESLPLDPHKEKENKKETENSNNKNNKEKKGAEKQKAQDEYSEADIDKFCETFKNYWNETLKQHNSRLRPICVIDATRRARLANLRRHFNGDQIYYFVHRAAISPYLNARKGNLTKPADLNWMLATDERIVKIIEGSL